MSAVFKLENVTRSFTQGHKAIEVLRGVNLELQPGEMVGLVGASGSGKSTLLQIAGLLDHPSSGRINIAGDQLENANDDMRTMVRQSKLGFVYQFHHLLPDFTAVENVRLALEIAGTGGDIHQKACDILERMGLSERLGHIPAALSGGEQQRVAIARAIVTNPLVLLADEPTGNLDEETAARVFKSFLDLVRAEGLTALIATHDQNLAQKMDRQFRLTEGRLVPVE